MHQLTVQPTWRTAVVRKKLRGSPQEFQIELMDGAFKDLRIIVHSVCLCMCEVAPFGVIDELRFVERSSQVPGVPARKDA